MESKQKEVAWLGSSREALRDFPKPVRRKLGHAVWDAQLGRFPKGRSRSTVSAAPAWLRFSRTTMETLTEPSIPCVCGGRLCVACISKEVKERREDTRERR